MISIVYAVSALALTAAPAPLPPAPSAAPPAEVVSPSPPAAARCCLVPAGTVIDLEISEAVGTKIQKSDDRFAIRVMTPLVVNGAVVVRAGASGFGQVVDSAPPGMGGRAAKLVLAARYIDQDGTRIPLRSFKLGGRGTDTTDAAIAISLSGLAFPPLAFAGLAVTGGNVNFPAGTRANAKIAADITLPTLDAAPAPAPGPGPPAAAPPPSMTPPATPDKGPTP